MGRSRECVSAARQTGRGQRRWRLRRSTSWSERLALPASNWANHRRAAVRGPSGRLWHHILLRGSAGAAYSPSTATRRRRRRELHSDQRTGRSEEHTSELQSLMRISYAVFCLKKKKKKNNNDKHPSQP